MRPNMDRICGRMVQQGLELASIALKGNSGGLRSTRNARHALGLFARRE